MKTKNIFSSLIWLTVAFFTIPNTLTSQAPDWNTLGNLITTSEYFGALTGSTVPVVFAHQSNGLQSRFEWHTNNGSLQERMRLTQNGWLGLNTTAPVSLFNVNNGTVIFDGFTGANPNLGAGTRFMWLPSSGAIRAGTTFNDEWDSGNVGLNSAAFGFNQQISGNTSLGAGSNNTVEGQSAGALGSTNNSNGDYCFSIGTGNTAGEQNTQDEGCIALGDGNQVFGHDCVGLGEGNAVDGISSIVLGFNNTVIGGACFSAGSFNVVNTIINSPPFTNCDNSFALGFANSVTDNCSVAIGRTNQISSERSFCIGVNLNSSANDNFVIGNSFNSAPIDNNISNSIMMGMNSDVPTLFIGDSGGSGSFGNVGIGNITNPTEVLDVNGTVRMRQVPLGNNQEVLITGNQITAAGDYQLNYSPFSGNSNEFLNGQGDWVVVQGSADCDWDDDGTNVWTGTGLGCEPAGNVGIGTASPTSKVDVFDDKFGSQNVETAARIIFDTGDLDNTGLKLEMNTLTAQTVDFNTGMDISIENARTNIGLKVKTEGSNITTSNIGVYSKALDQGVGFTINIGLQGHALGDGGAQSTAFGVHGTGEGGDFNVGVYGTTPTGVPNSWAAYFDGRGYLNSGTWVYGSDEMLKKDIQDLEVGLEAIMQLEPKTYEYRCDEFPQMNLVSGHHCGLIAQEVEEVLPGIVEDISLPETYDEEGNLLYEGLEFKGVKYTELLPVVISAIQEQQNIIEDLQSQLSELYEAMETCCAVTGSLLNTSEGNDLQVFVGESSQLLQNQPNPFSSSTVINYSLSCDCKATIRIYNSNGQLIDTLIDQKQSEGNHSLQWHAPDLASGIYFYSLEVDGAEQVRRAVKM